MDENIIEENIIDENIMFHIVSRLSLMVILFFISNKLAKDGQEEKIVLKFFYLSSVSNLVFFMGVYQIFDIAYTLVSAIDFSNYAPQDTLKIIGIFIAFMAVAKLFLEFVREKEKEKKLSLFFIREYVT